MRFSNQVLNGLSLAHWDAMSPHLTEVELSAGQTLFHPGEKVELVYFPGGSVLSVVTVMRNGSSAEIATIGNEGMAGLVPALTGHETNTHIFAQWPGRAVALRADMLRLEIARQPALLIALLGDVQRVIAQAEQSAACSALHSGAERLARLLLQAEDRLGSKSFAITQEALATALAVQRTTVTAIANDFRHAGLVSYHRGKIEIVNRPGLERRACECYRALRPMTAEAI